MEQIGYVYEGLLETEVRTAPAPMVGLVRSTKKGQAWPRPKAPAEVSLASLDAWQVRAELTKELALRTGRTESAVETALARLWTNTGNAPYAGPPARAPRTPSYSPRWPRCCTGTTE